MLNHIGNIDFSQFHFIRPEWLWSLAVFVLLWLLIGRINQSTHWESFIAKDKLEALRVTGGRASKIWQWLLILGWTLGTVAAAGPTWKQVPVPTVRDESAMVIVLDLSRSMLAEDISPDRLTRAKFKLIDILRQRGDGQTALVAYAGDPHTVSPLTDDPRTIEALLPALHPNIMPVQGSNTEAAIDLSLQLLKDAGVSQGEILLLTDGVASDAQRHIRDLYDGSFRLSILGIGSTEAVPIPRETGGFFTDSRGEIILTRLNRDELQILAGLSAGRYVEMQPDDSDIKYLLEDNFEIADDSEGAENALLYDSWEDMGYWLVLLLLPFVAHSFRKGAIYLFPLMFILPNHSEAQTWDAVAFGWDDLWLNKDQQAAKMLAEDPAGAAETFVREDWAAVADFNAQNYQSAAERFAGFEDIENTYNLGNALAFNGDLQGALDAYNQVLEQRPEHKDAAHNKAVIEQLMQQQDQQQEDSSESGENSEEQSQSDSENSSQDQQSQDQQGQDQQNQEQQNQQGQEQQDNQQQGSEGQDAEQSDSEQQGQQSEAGQDEPQQQQDQASQSEQESDQQNQSEQQSAQQQEAEQGTEETESAQASEQDQGANESEQEQAAMMAAEPTPDALEDSSEQWLRTIPDDPSGLLRRKFDYQSRQNRLEQRYRLQVPSNPDDERY